MKLLKPTFLAAFAGFIHACGAFADNARPASGRDADGIPQQRFEFHQPHMGVPFRIVLHGTDPESARDAARAAFDRIRRLNDILSDYDRNSELSRLSDTAGTGQRVEVSEDLWIVLEHARRWSETTDGAFDVTIGSMVALWRKARREGRLPDPALVERARAASGYRHLHLDPAERTVELTRPGMRLDLGGIAKGYAVDEALKVLRARGFPRAMVSGAGDIGVGDPPPNRNAWQIEIAPPEEVDPAFSRFAALTNAALATSGDVFQRLIVDGKRYSHILDPRTGTGLTDSALVTVIASDCMTADALSTAISVLGVEQGLERVNATPGAAALIMRVTEDGLETIESSRLASFLVPDPPSRL